MPLEPCRSAAAVAAVVSGRESLEGPVHLRDRPAEAAAQRDALRVLKHDLLLAAPGSVHRCELFGRGGGGGAESCSDLRVPKKRQS